MTETSIFDLLQPAQTPSESDLRTWLKSVFPDTTDRSAFQLVLRLERLFEVSLFENRVKDMHMLLQQGVSPNIRWDWGLTPLMCSNYLGYEELSKLLINYGATSQAKSFSGKTASEFRQLPIDDPSEECMAILTRYTEIHDQVMAGLLKPFSDGTGNPPKTNPTPAKNTPNHAPTPKKIRQIDNGKGVDEIFKKISGS